VPVVTVSEARNAAADLVNGTRGFVVQPDAHAIAGAVRTLLADVGLRERMSAGAREAARGYGWDGIVGELREMYGGLV
jgi:glycosyltransferase involved in cell wall biosynthesis